MGPAHLDFPNSKVAHIPVRMCPYCHRPLMKIDHYGEVLVDCIDCNRSRAGIGLLFDSAHRLRA
jgi:hypothetical protein